MKISYYELKWYDIKIKPDEINNKTVDECLKNLRLTVSDEPRKYIDNTQKIIATE